MSTIQFRTYSILAVSIIFTACFLVALTAHAESIMWGTTIQSTLCVDSLNEKCSTELYNPHVDIQYLAQVTDESTGAVVACGSTVSSGTTLLLEFVPHEPKHIYWFGTGYADDSPNGYWRNGATPEAPACREQDYITSNPGPRNKDGVGHAQFVPLIVNPPQKNIDGIGGMSCSAVSGTNNYECTPSAGTYTPQFTFGSTFGYFYSNYAACPSCESSAKVGTQKSPTGQTIIVNKNIPAKFTKGGKHPMCASNQSPMGIKKTYRTPYQLAVPTKSITCPITVIQSMGQPPSSPILLSSSTACVVGTPHTISMTATDADGDGIRYGVDWNADGLIDEFVPPTGYVPSGTQRTASRTYSTDGSKTVKVLAQDDKGTSSSWATLTFSCSNPPTAQCADGADNDGDGFIDLLDSNCADASDVSEFAAFVPPVPPPPPPASDSPDLTIRAVPSLVRSGATTKVHWSASNVEACTVSGSNGDAWTGISSSVGGNTSSAIASRTVYTISCIDTNGLTLTKQAVVNILPSWKEI